MYKTIPSKPYFKVSINSQVIWASTGTKLSPYKDKDGYVRYSYRKDGKTYHVAAHRAVAEVFVNNPRPNDYNQVNHINGVKDDNSPSNLEWTNSKGNRSHAQFSGLHSVKGVEHSQCNTSEDTIRRMCTLLELGLTHKDISEQLNIPRYQITNVKTGKSRRHISNEYDLEIPKKDTVSKSTLAWIKNCLEDGKDIKEILKLNNKLRESDKNRILHLIGLVKFND